MKKRILFFILVMCNALHKFVFVALYIEMEIQNDLLFEEKGYDDMSNGHRKRSTFACILAV